MRPLNKLSIFGTLALAATLAGSACSKSASGDGTFPDDPAPATPTTPTPGTPTPTTAKYAGIYQANAPIDFTQNGVLPGIASPALNALTMVGTNPGRALVNMAQAAGAINISSTLRNILGDIITGQLNSIMSQDVMDALDLISNIAKITQTGVLKNKLTIHTPKADGTVAVDIELSGAGFDFVDIQGTAQHVDVTVPAAAAATAKSTMTMATLAARPNAPVADADLTLSGGSLSIPIGDFIMQAAGPLIFQPAFGKSDLKSALTYIMTQPCIDFGNAIHNSVQGTPILESISADVYKTICTTAVGLAATEIISQISMLKIDGVKITNGRAVLFDTSMLKPTMDHQSDRIADGTWSWSFGSTDVPSTLAGDRTGNAN